jgi:hypothetical protein
MSTDVDVDLDLADLARDLGLSVNDVLAAVEDGIRAGFDRTIARHRRPKMTMLERDVQAARRRRERAANKEACAQVAKATRDLQANHRHAVSCACRGGACACTIKTASTAEIALGPDVCRGLSAEECERRMAQIFRGYGRRLKAQGADASGCFRAAEEIEAKCM